MQSLDQQITVIAQNARAASLALATIPTAQKNAALNTLADLITQSEKQLLEANAADLAAAQSAGLAPAFIDRLTLNPERIAHLAESVRQVAALPDPVGEILSQTTRPNDLLIQKVRVPIGVIAIIYESRPNVTIDCAILCLKSGNSTILRGGKECFHTNTALAALIQKALATAGIPSDAVQLIPTTDRAALNTLLKLDHLIHCVIPRGGESLIRYVAGNSTIPVIKHYNGVCFVYLDKNADPSMSQNIVLNAKTQRPSACNALEQLLVHADAAPQLLPKIAQALVNKNVSLLADEKSAAILAKNNIPHKPAAPADFKTEFLSLTLAIRIVNNTDDAIATINADGSGHSDAIITPDQPTAQKFLQTIDSATVYWNASPRFTDGFEFGFGAEIGISTDRLHARGPMALPELTTYKYLLTGTGQTRP